MQIYTMILRLGGENFTASNGVGKKFFKSVYVVPRECGNSGVFVFED